MRKTMTTRELRRQCAEAGFTLQATFNTGTDDPLAVVGFELRGPRGNKTFLPVENDAVDADSFALWVDGINYATKKINERRCA